MRDSNFERCSDAKQACRLLHGFPREVVHRLRAVLARYMKKNENSFGYKMACVYVLFSDLLECWVRKQRIIIDCTYVKFRQLSLKFDH